MTTWQPIETAPKDETRILLYRDRNYFAENIAVCWYNKEWHEWTAVTGNVFYYATHWMPLPDFPFPDFPL